MNKVILTGNVCKIYYNNNNVRFTLADNYKEKTTYIPIVVFGQTALFVAKHVTPGDHVMIEGYVGTRKQQATGYEVTEIVANTVNFEGYKRPGKTMPETQYTTNPATKQKDPPTQPENNKSWANGEPSFIIGYEPSETMTLDDLPPYSDDDLVF